MSDLPRKYKPLTSWDYFGLTILYSIPVLGFILLLVHSFSQKNINRRNFARSFWCWLVALLCVLALFVGISYATGNETVVQDLLDAAPELSLPFGSGSGSGSYETIYEDYTLQMRELTPQLIEEYDALAAEVGEEAALEQSTERLREISVEGEAAMADYWMNARHSSHEEYVEWVEKLSAVLEEECETLSEAVGQAAG